VKRTGKFITQEELEQLRTAQACSGMFLSGGRAMGDPAGMCDDLNRKYGLSGHAIDPRNGEFVDPA
jgi:hypothetical protein